MYYYRGKKQCAACGEPASVCHWKDERRAICWQCDAQLEAGRKLHEDMKTANCAPIRIRLSTYTPSPYFEKKDIDFGIDFSKRKGHRMLRPPYMCEDSGKYDSQMFNKAINDFLSVLDTGVPDSTPLESIHCDDGTQFRNFVTLKKEHAIAWIKFYDELSQFCIELQDRAKQEGGNFLMALMKKEVDLYQG